MDIEFSAHFAFLEQSARCAQSQQVGKCETNKFKPMCLNMLANIGEGHRMYEEGEPWFKKQIH